MDFQPWQTLWRLAGVDHMYVHGLQGKFAQSDAEVIDGARAASAPLADASDTADRVMPTLFGAMAIARDDRRGTQRRSAVHGSAAASCAPGGLRAGVTSLRQVLPRRRDGIALADAAAQALNCATRRFGAKH